MGTAEVACGVGIVAGAASRPVKPSVIDQRLRDRKLIERVGRAAEDARAGRQTGRFVGRAHRLRNHPRLKRRRQSTQVGRQRWPRAALPLAEAQVGAGRAFPDEHRLAGAVSDLADAGFEPQVKHATEGWRNRPGLVAPAEVGSLGEQIGGHTETSAHRQTEGPKLEILHRIFTCARRAEIRLDRGSGHRRRLPLPGDVEVVEVLQIRFLNKRKDGCKAADNQVGLGKARAKLGRGPLRKPIPGVVVVVHRQANLLEIVGARHAAGSFPRRLHRRQQQPHKDADDGNHDEQFYEREARLLCSHGFPPHSLLIPSARPWLARRGFPRASQV